MHANLQAKKSSGPTAFDGARRGGGGQLLCDVAVAAARLPLRSRTFLKFLEIPRADVVWKIENTHAASANRENIAFHQYISQT